VLLTDTVGFISKLPTDLIAAFRATLEEVHQPSPYPIALLVTTPFIQPTVRPLISPSSLADCHNIFRPLPPPLFCVPHNA